MYSTEEQKSEVKAKAREVYKNIGSYAHSNHTTIHLLKIEDSNKNENCYVQTLQIMCELTGGKIETVEPKGLKELLLSILSEKIIAYDVEVKCILYPALKFRNQP